jgi:hypothetical protein
MLRMSLAVVCATAFVAAPAMRAQDRPANYVAGTLVQLNDNGAWSWFMDPRVIVDNGKLIVGSVRAVGSYQANITDSQWGNVEISVFDIATGVAKTTVLHSRLEQDDHDVPAFLVLKDGRYLAMYSKHTRERLMYYRVSEPRNALAWSAASAVQTPGDENPVRGDNVTYANLFRFPDGRIYNFYRGFSHDPNYMFSDDDGKTWANGGRWLYGRDGYAPYLKYAYDGKGTLHFVTTEDHPRNFDNSLYHGYLKNGTIHHSNGTAIGPLNTGQEAKIATWDVTRVYQGGPDNVAWMVDIELDRSDRPYVIFSTQRDGRGLPRGEGGFDLRYHYARWDGKTWNTEEIAYAGTKLYPGEDDYSGLAALDPNNPDVVYISTDADPVTNAPLISAADKQRHYELYRGVRGTGGKWTWTPVTRDSTVDNTRPLVPKWDDQRTALVWMRGEYVHNHGEWYSAVVAMIVPPQAASSPAKTSSSQ